MTVSQETLAQPARAKRRYQSPARQHQRDRTHRALLDAALSFVTAGVFRPQARQIEAKAGAGRGSVARHFGSIDLLYRAIAREHTATVIRTVEREWAVSLTCDHAELAWFIMVGKPRELS